MPDLQGIDNRTQRRRISFTTFFPCESTLGFNGVIFNITQIKNQTEFELSKIYLASPENQLNMYSSHVTRQKGKIS
jgi:hypothetical protein